MSGLPDGWVLSELGTVARLEMGQSPAGNATNSKGRGLPLVGGAADFKAGQISPSRHTDQPTKVSLPGDIILCIRATIGKAAFGADSYCLGRGVAGLRPDAIGGGLLRYLLARDARELDAAGTGTTFRQVDKSTLSRWPVPLPPLTEQLRIVAKLDALTARTARARADLDRIPTLAARYKKAVIDMALSGKLTLDWRRQRAMPDGADQSATITTPFVYTLTAPSSWSGMPLLQACEIVGGSQPPKSTFVYADGQDLIRLIQIRDYKSDAHIVFIPKQLARRFCDDSDVMIGRYGPPVFQILRGLNGAYNVALMKAVPKEELLSKDYLFWLLSHPTLRRYVELDAKRTAGQDGVNKAHLEKFPIFLPSLDEQVEIVIRIKKSLAEIDRLAAEAAAARRLLDRLDQAVLAKAFRGELVPQDPADEPASVLLDRIGAERAAAPKAKRGRKMTA